MFSGLIILSMEVAYMRYRLIFGLFVILAFLSGCGGNQGSVSPKDAYSLTASLPDKTFEVARVQLTVSPNPPEASKMLFNKLAAPYMSGISDSAFASGLSDLLKRDLGINVDYSKLRSNYNYKISQKAGFVWDKNLYAWQAIKKFKTGDQSIEITSIAPNPTITGVETLITVKNGSTVIKEYKIQAVMNSKVSDGMYKQRATDYFAHIPQLLELGITGFIIGDFDIVQYIVDSTNTIEQLKLKRNPPEKALKKLREMVTDIDPSSGIVMEDITGENSAEPASQESGSGATLLD